LIVYILGIVFVVYLCPSKWSDIHSEHNNWLHYKHKCLRT